MEILEEILKEQKSQKAEIEKLTKVVTDMKGKVDNPKPVQMDTTQVTSKIYSSLAAPIDELKSKLQTATQEVSNLIGRIPKSIRVDGVMGFTSVKSMIAYLSFLMVPIVISTYIYLNYQESRLGQRLDRANKRIESVDQVIKVWIEGNPNDSKSFKKEINVKVLGETF